MWNTFAQRGARCFSSITRISFALVKEKRHRENRIIAGPQREIGSMKSYSYPRYLPIARTGSGSPPMVRYYLVKTMMSEPKRPYTDSA